LADVKDQFKDGGIVLDNAIGFWIHRVYQASRNELFRGFREAGASVTPEQWAILVRLWENDGQTQTALSDSTFRDKPTMSRILDVLERDGLVTRRDDPSDGRVRIVVLTRQGRELRRKLVPVAERIVGKMVAGIAEHELETTRGALKVMFANLTA
jgi:MarR family transcriptional regulator, organic hydroperoxide resistance regulator